MFLGFNLAVIAFTLGVRRRASPGKSKRGAPGVAGAGRRVAGGSSWKIGNMVILRKKRKKRSQILNVSERTFHGLKNICMINKFPRHSQQMEWKKKRKEKPQPDKDLSKTEPVLQRGRGIDALGGRSVNEARPRRRRPFFRVYSSLILIFRRVTADPSQRDAPSPRTCDSIEISRGSCGVAWKNGWK